MSVVIFDIPRATGRLGRMIDVAFAGACAWTRARGASMLVHPEWVADAPPGALRLDAAGPDEVRAVEITEEIVAALRAPLGRLEISDDDHEALHFKLAAYNAEVHGAVRAVLWAQEVRSMVGRGALYIVPSPTQRCFFAARLCGPQVAPLWLGGAAGRALAALTTLASDHRFGRRWNAHEIPFEPTIETRAPSREVSEGRRALAFATMPNYLNSVGPLLTALADKGMQCGAIVPAGVESWSTTARLGDAHRYALQSWIDTDELRQARRARHRLRETLRAVQGELNLALSTRLPISVYDAVRRGLERTILETAPALRAFRVAIARIMDDYRPDLLVVARLRRALERIAAQEASRRGAKVAMMLHGHVAESPAMVYTWGSFHQADLVLAWNVEQADTIATLDPPARDRVVITSNPAWDALTDVRPSPLIETQLGLPRGEKMLMVATNPSVLSCLRWLVDGLSSWRKGPHGTRVVFKLHPGEARAAYEQTLAGRAGFSIVHGEHTLDALLPHAWAVVAGNSTANLDALAAGVPVVLVQQDSGTLSHRFMDLARHGIPEVSDARALATTLDAVASGRLVITAPESLIPRPEGGASRAAATACISTLERASPPRPTPTSH